MNSTPKVIVTRNLQGKDPSAKYSARLVGETASQERKFLVVRDVGFIETYNAAGFEYESGFGCGIVARGSLVGSVVGDELSSLMEIHFNGLVFCTKHTKQHVTSAKLVVFSEHGIFAAL